VNKAARLCNAKGEGMIEVILRRFEQPDEVRTLDRDFWNVNPWVLLEQQGH
jgi:hypothetical protein